MKNNDLRTLTRLALLVAIELVMKAIGLDAGYLCGRQQGADRGPAVSRTQVLTTDNALTSVSEVRINKIYPA